MQGNIIRFGGLKGAPMVTDVRYALSKCSKDILTVKWNYMLVFYGVIRLLLQQTCQAKWLDMGYVRLFSGTLGDSYGHRWGLYGSSWKICFS